MLVQYRFLFLLFPLFLLFLLFSFKVAANEHPVAMIEDLDESFNLSPYLETIEDPDHSITFDDIQSGKFEGLWVLNQEPVFVGKNVDSRYWFRIKLHFSDRLILTNSVLEIFEGTRALLYLKIWLPINDPIGNSLEVKKKVSHGYRSVETGDRLPVGSRDISSLIFGFRVPVVSSHQTILGWVHNRKGGHPVTLPITLVTTEQFNIDSQLVLSIIVAFYAVMLTLFVYNICLFLSLREPLYGVYSLFLVCAVTFVGNVDGTGVFWFSLNDFNEDVRKLLYIGPIIFGLMFYSVFIWMSLNRFSFLPWLKKIYYAQLLMGLVTFSLVFIATDNLLENMFLSVFC